MGCGMVGGGGGRPADIWLYQQGSCVLNILKEFEAMVYQYIDAWCPELHWWSLLCPHGSCNHKRWNGLEESSVDSSDMCKIFDDGIFKMLFIKRGTPVWRRKFGGKGYLPSRVNFTFHKISWHLLYKLNKQRFSYVKVWTCVRCQRALNCYKDWSLCLWISKKLRKILEHLLLFHDNIFTSFQEKKCGTLQCFWWNITTVIDRLLSAWAQGRRPGTRSSGTA